MKIIRTVLSYFIFLKKPSMIPHNYSTGEAETGVKFQVSKGYLEVSCLKQNLKHPRIKCALDIQNNTSYQWFSSLSLWIAQNTVGLFILDSSRRYGKNLSINFISNSLQVQHKLESTSLLHLYFFIKYIPHIWITKSEGERKLNGGSKIVNTP